MKSLDEVTARVDRHRLDDIARQHLRVRFRCMPDAMPAELHQLVARWLRVVERATGAEQDRRTAEAIRAVMQITDWTEVDARLALRIVADHLSPKEPTSDDDAATRGSAPAVPAGGPAGGTMDEPGRSR